MSSITIAIIGLGYVGLPLAVEFAKKYKVIGFDINQDRVNHLQQGNDSTLEVTTEELLSVLRDSNQAPDKTGLFITTDTKALAEANYYIVTVPTPTDKNNRPDLTPLIKATETIAKHLKPNDTVIYESTVYPGATEEVCVPILTKISSLTYATNSTQHSPLSTQHSKICQLPTANSQDFTADCPLPTAYFFCGYSPERINPGDKLHTVTKIKKITSGSTPEAAEKIDALYRSIITAGTYKASSIKVAEAAKVIENSQRDINIAFVNELAMIFNRLGIDTNQVLEAAGTKWNFLPFKPGLVGGHCIGVDPYYLAQKAQESGYHPEIILAGRRLNDNMGKYIASEVIKLLISRDYKVKGASILMLGITFKENCPDIRNTKAVDIARELHQYGAEVEIHDPWAHPDDVKHEYNLESLTALNGNKYDAIILTVAHDHFKTLNIRQLLNSPNGILYDVKGMLPPDQVDGRL
jgi:UDP-N-acetyl-D-galactosamine dehydrogenase